MGNLVSFSNVSAASASGGKIVLLDGSVRPFNEPVSVAELMMEHPRHFVIDARLLASGGAKVSPLPADHMLDAGKVYIVLPAMRGKVSVDEARRVLLASRTLARSRSMPMLARKLSGLARKSAAIDADRSEWKDATERTTETARPDRLEEQRPEFLSRELSSRGWKPSLRTIEERVLDKKVPHWLF